MSIARDLAALRTPVQVVNGGTGKNTIAGLVDDLKTAGVYAKTNAVGVVSQASGVPTGAIIERGSNANGEYIKYADGTLICWRVQTAPVAMTSAYGNIFNGASFGSVDYPHPFIAVPSAIQTMNAASGVVWAGSNGVSSATQWVGMFPLGAVSQASVSVTLNRYAIGRWY